MRHIRKGKKPAELARFERENAETALKGTYKALNDEVRQALAKKMLKEQGRLCAYTMQRIGRSKDRFADCHIEHIHSQESRPELRLDYANMVLCAPGRDTKVCKWGARAKDNTQVNEGNFISPLRADCESRLIYRADGTVRPARETDEAAAATIKVLNLNDGELRAERARTMRALGLSRDANRPIGGKEARRLSEKICLPNAKGDFEPFCVAVRQVAGTLAERVEQRAARLRKLP